MKQNVLKGVNLTVDEGEFVSIMETLVGGVGFLVALVISFFA